MYLNDQNHQEAPALFTEVSRAVFYSDVLFETIRVVNGVPLLFDHHLKRLYDGMLLLGMQWPEQWNKASLLDQIKTGFPGDVRLRWTVWRKPGGLYAPTDHAVGYCMTASPLSDSWFIWPEQVLDLGICTSVQLPLDTFSGVKTMNAARYVQAAREAKRMGWEDGLLLNSKDRICEATSSNLFWWEKGELYTVPLAEGCVAGVFRAFLMEEAPKLGIRVLESVLEPEKLRSVDGLFLTNAIRGIVPAQMQGAEAGVSTPLTRELAFQLASRLQNA